MPYPQNLLPLLLNLYLLSASIQPTLCTVLDLTQPSLISWVIGNRTSTLIVYDFQFGNFVRLGRIGGYGAGYLRVGRNVSFTSRKAYVYQPVEVLHQVSITYYYKSHNSTSYQGTLTSTINDLDPQPQPSLTSTPTPSLTPSTAPSLPLPPTPTLPTPTFSIHPNPHHPNSTPQFSSTLFFQMDQNPNIYQISSKKYHPDFDCNGWLVLDEQKIGADLKCNPVSAESVVDFGYFQSVGLGVGGSIGGDWVQVGFGGGGVGVGLGIDQSIMGSNLVVKPLSQMKFDLSKVTISFKTTQSPPTQTLTVTLTNPTETPLLLHLQCTQSSQTLYSSYHLLPPTSTQTFSTLLSKSAPSSQILFKVSNPLTKQFYSFRQASGVVDGEEVKVEVGGVGVGVKGGLGWGVFVGIGGGVLVVVLVVGGVVYRRRQEVKKRVKLSLQMQKESVITISTNSQRQFVNPSPDHPRTIPQLQIQPQLQLHLHLQPAHQKQKPQTSTTLDSDNLSHSHSNSNSNKNEHSEQKSELHVPSLEDKLEERQEIQIQPMPLPNIRRVRYGHRRNVSTDPMLPSMYGDGVGEGEKKM